MIPTIAAMAISSMTTAVVVHQWTVATVTQKLDEGFKQAVGGDHLQGPALMPARIPVVEAGPVLAQQGKTGVGKPSGKAGLANGGGVAPATKKAGEPAVGTAEQQRVLQAMLEEMRALRNENVALRDQMAETNRDLMKLEFRVDTHSASFRPLPSTTTDRAMDQPYVEDEAPGVLPNLGTLDHE